MSHIIAVVGMQREAKLLPDGCEIVIAGSDASTLTAKIEAAIARGGKAIISTGICGGLQPGLAVGTTVIASEIIFGHARLLAGAAWRSALLGQIGGIEGAIAGSDAIVSTPADKAKLYAATGAIAADMESYVAARVAAEHGLPFAALRVISDAAEDALPPATLTAMNAAGALDARALSRSLLRNPLQIPALIRTGRKADKAFAELLGSFRILGRGLGCPYLG